MATTGTDMVQESDGSFSKQIRLVAGTNNIGDVDVLSIAAGTNNIGRVGASVTEVTGTTNGANTVAAAGDYAALDILAHSASNGVGVNWQWAAAARENGGSGTITRVLLFCTAEAMTARIRIWFFNAATTTTEMDDNAAFLLDEDDMAKLIGWIDLPALARTGAAGELCATQWTGAFPFKCGADATLRGILQLLDADANESASMQIFPKLQIVQD